MINYSFKDREKKHQEILEEYTSLFNMGNGNCFYLPSASGLPDIYRKDEKRFKCFKTKITGENYVCQYEDINRWSQLGIIRSTDLVWKENGNFFEIPLEKFMDLAERVYEGKLYMQIGSGTDFYWVSKWKIKKFLLKALNF